MVALLKCIGLYPGRHDFTAHDPDPDLKAQDPALMAIIFCDNQGTLDFVLQRTPILYWLVEWLRASGE